jgi:hypothetical protein
MSYVAKVFTVIYGLPLPVAPHVTILLANSRNPPSCVGVSRNKPKSSSHPRQFANSIRNRGTGGLRYKQGSSHTPLGIYQRQSRRYSPGPHNHMLP